MFKKIALVTALVATASFATWDKFPVLEAGKGQAEIGAKYTIAGDASQLGLFGQARYSVISNLELGVAVPFVLFTDNDGADGPDGIDNIPVMVRYQFMPILNAFVDVSIPTGDEEVVGPADGLGVYFGVQYSQAFGAVNFGSELGLGIRTEGDDEQSPPYDLKVGAEGQFPLGMVTTYVGVDFVMWLGEYTHDGDSAPGADDSGTIGFVPYVGANIGINQMMYADVSASFDLRDDKMRGTKDTPITLTAKFGINF